MRCRRSLDMPTDSGVAVGMGSAAQAIGPPTSKTVLRKTLPIVETTKLDPE
ncbi:MAG: hypothetical protein DHS20C12_18830 [Pseudohongiella sp.]|nr:MAG: hypothetical protein DHS20C12_18830 [Pseudohongiella sp.]